MDNLNSDLNDSQLNKICEVVESVQAVTMDNLNSDLYDSQLNKVCENVEEDQYNPQLVKACEDVEEDEELYNAGELASQQIKEPYSQVGRGIKRPAADPVAEPSAKKNLPSTSRENIATNQPSTSRDTSTTTSTVQKPTSKMVKLYKLDFSPPSRAAMMACELFNVPAEYIEVNLMEKDQLKPDFLKINPLHTIPVLEVDDIIIHDSHAILMYLADVYGKQDSFYPKDPKQRALVNQKLFFNNSILFPRMRYLTYRLFQEGHNDIPQKNLDDIVEAYGFTEEFLSRTKYLAGDNLTIADIAAFPLVTTLLCVVDLNVQKYPKLHAWLKDLEKLPWIEKNNTKGNQMLKQLFESKLA